MTATQSQDAGVSNGPMLKLDGVHKRFGKLEVLRGIDLEVGRGEVVCVLGPSGSGKSTLLRCINLLEPPEQGRITLEDHAIAGENATDEIDFVRQRVGMVFQQFNLFAHKSALANVRLAQEKVLGRSKQEATDKAEALLNRVGLSDKLGEFPD